MLRSKGEAARGKTPLRGSSLIRLGVGLRELRNDHTIGREDPIPTMYRVQNRGLKGRGTGNRHAVALMGEMVCRARQGKSPAGK